MLENQRLKAESVFGIKPCVLWSKEHGFESQLGIKFLQLKSGSVLQTDNPIEFLNERLEENVSPQRK